MIQGKSARVSEVDLIQTGMTAEREGSLKEVTFKCKTSGQVSRRGRFRQREPYFVMTPRLEGAMGGWTCRESVMQTEVSKGSGLDKN